MAKIFISMQNVAGKTGLNVMPPFYEAFVNGLKAQGNDILCYHFNTVRREFVSIIPDSIKNLIIKFAPDICIIFNNNFWDMTEFVSCPIVIYDVDSPLYFLHGESIKKNIDRYLFVTSQIESVRFIKELYNAKDNQIAVVPFFTEIQAEKIDIANNIVFIGSNWTWKGEYFVRDFMLSNPSKDEIEMAKMVLKKYSEYPFTTSSEIYNDNGWFANKRINLQELSRCNLEISGLRRINYLQSVADFGLEIRGIYWDRDWMKYFPDLLLSYNNKQTFSLKDTQDFFNSAKIGFSTNHIQAISGYSWRTCDIIASNACLLCEYRKGIQDAFPNVKLPMFTNQYEAREMAERLLKNENERLEIVEAAHEVLDKKYRFMNVLILLQDFFKLKIINVGNAGNIEFVSDEYKELYPYGYVEEMKERNRRNSVTVKGWNKLAVNNPKLNKQSIRIGKIKLASIVHFEKEIKFYLWIIPIIGMEKNANSYKIRLLAIRYLRRKTKDIFNRVKKSLVKMFAISRKEDCIVYFIGKRKHEIVNKKRYEKMCSTLRVLYKYEKINKEILDKYEKRLLQREMFIRMHYKTDFKQYLEIVKGIDPCSFPCATGALRDYQKQLVDFYVEISEVFETNNIQYTLSGGGLIGAVRQKGFMPWDDDIDLELVREEYEKAKTILAQKFYWFDSNHCKSFSQFFKELNGLMKVYKDKVIITETPSCVKIIKGTSLNDCLMLELFPYDYISNEISEDDFNKYLKTAQKCRRTVPTWGAFFNQMKKDREQGNVFVEKSNRLYYGYGNRGFVEFEFSGFRRAKSLFPINKKMEFEGVQMPVPNDVDEWLSYQYGDYMSLPKYIEENVHITERKA